MTNLPPNARVLTPLDDAHAAFDVTDERAMKALAAAEDAHFWHRARNRFIADRLHALGISATAKILELGCGGGSVTAHLATRGYEVVGVDGHLDLVARAAARAPQAKFFVHDLGRGLDAVPGKDFDVVALFDVIEHLDDPRAALEEALTRVRPGGFVVGTVPALMALWSDVDVQAGHRLRYDEASLSKLVSSLERAREPRVLPFYRALVPMLFVQRKLVVKRGDVGATSAANFAVPPKPLNDALYAVVRAEARLSALFERAKIPGSCLWFQARKTALRGRAAAMVFGKVTQVLRDRRRKEEMANAGYWDERAKQRSGFARSVWHSESFSRVWDLRQREMLRRSLGPLRDKALADVGCGTGRVTRFFASEGAKATGFDFSPATVEAAEEETREAGLSATFVVADVTSGALPAEPRSFDAAVAVGCLAVACRDLSSLERALAGMAGIVKPSGLVVLLEPIHTTRFLGRVLRAPVDEWVAAGAAAGLRLLSSSGMGFVPARLALSSLDLPPWLVRPTFAIGERALDKLPVLTPTSDCRLLVFRPT